INEIAYDLASSAPTTVAGNSRADYLITEATKVLFINEEVNQIQARKCILREINGYHCPEFFYLEKVQKRFNKYVKNLRINRYKPSCESCRRTPTISLNGKNPIQARELLIWIQRSIPDKFSFLLKDKDGNTNVVPLNQFLSQHKITSFILRKIGANHASRVHGGKNDTGRQHLRQLAYRHKIGHASSVEHYGVINDRPIIPTPKQENSEVEDIINLYGEISDDDN
ncbi:16944_t:CDS:2, partial [Dentiscutata erythropus]